MKKILSATLHDLDASVVECESTFTKALPSFSIVGLASSAIQEAKDRVKSALVSNGYTLPPLKITVNLAPSDITKSGSHFDLPIALLIALQNEDIDTEDWFVFGELGLDGTVKNTNNLFAIILLLLNRKEIKRVVVPKELINELKLIPDLEVFGVAHLNDAIDFFINPDRTGDTVITEFKHKFIEVNSQKYYYKRDYPLDFNDVLGQSRAKRVALIAASGMHNLIFEGSPGCGKSMIIKRLQYILPPLKIEEIFDIAKNTSLDGGKISFDPKRPFRMVHHTATKSSILGGGAKNAQIGEIGLANLGIIFFDELPHFNKSVLESLREPLEDDQVVISRVNSKVKYSTKFMFTSAMNPCPCGNLLNSVKKCTCSETDINRYKNKISEPFIDRIDLFVQMQESRDSDKERVTSKDMHSQVLEAFMKQKERGQLNLNSKLTDSEIANYCILSDEANKMLNQSANNFNISLRSINKIKKVARTIADLDSSDKIEVNHLIESLSYRKR